eukprot:TRINITY_DN7624_c0_g1_i1.p1 TRINITY_DN7624_c0_g1~~TRINITY_DN7624_c0_g1_i1.p1  ORF type:complete len:223 (-),score=80.38 TRINITY_DN7624_c0_g1_i1:83-658(-)
MSQSEAPSSSKELELFFHDFPILEGIVERNQNLIFRSTFSTSPTFRRSQPTSIPQNQTLLLSPRSSRSTGESLSNDAPSPSGRIHRFRSTNNNPNSPLIQGSTPLPSLFSSTHIPGSLFSSSSPTSPTNTSISPPQGVGGVGEHQLWIFSKIVVITDGAQIETTIPLEFVFIQILKDPFGNDSSRTFPLLN